jgi:hypothetical protein
MESPPEPKDHWFRVYGCPEDMPINRCLLRSPKDHWFRVYGCPEDMPGAARLPDNLDLTEQWRDLADLVV